MERQRKTADLPLLKPRVRKGQSFKLIGAGGIGQALLYPLVIFLASIEKATRLVVIDGDDFESANRTRVFYSRPGNKAQVSVEQYAERLPRNSRLTLTATPEYLSPANIARLIQPGDIVLLCVDNLKTRALVTRHARSLRDVTIISGGNDGVGPDSSGELRRGTAGNVQVAIRCAGRCVGPELDTFHPEIANPPDKAPYELGCAELVASQPQLLVANLYAATAMFSTLFLHLCSRPGVPVLRYGELAFDFAQGRMVPLPLGRCGAGV